MKVLASVFKQHPMSIVVGLLASITLIGINEFGYRQAVSALNEQDRVRLIQGVTVELVGALKAAESAQRGYLLTGDEAFFTQYESEANSAQVELTRFIELERPFRPAETPDGDIPIETKILNRLSEMAVSVNLKRSGHPVASEYMVSAETGRQEMNSLLDQLKDMRRENRQTAKSLLQKVRDAIESSRFWVITMMLATFVAFLLYSRQRWMLNQRTQAHSDFMASHATALESERNQLEQLVKQRTISLRELATNLQVTSEETRSRLARELHDELGSLLTATKLHIARIKSKVSAEDEAVQQQIQSLNQTLNQVIAIKRRIIEDLRPSSLENFGLVVALDILQSEFQERTGIAIEAELEQVELDPPSQLALYRIVQESLNNITKYAQATLITLKLRSLDDHIELLIEDNGVGFDQAVIKPRSHGLAGMRHRVESLRGALQVSSAPGHGTSILALIPQMGGDTLQSMPTENEAD